MTQTQFIEEYYQKIFGFIHKRVSDKELALDLTQDVFYKLAKSSNDSIENIIGWVYSIARNSIIDHYRKAKLPQEEIADHLENLEKDEPSLEARNELSNCIKPMVKDLPEEYAGIVSQSELEGIAQKELAEKLNMNYTTLRSKVQRGRKLLKSAIQECCHIERDALGRVIDHECKSSCGEGC